MRGTGREGILRRELARFGIATRAAEERGIPRVALSGGVAYNRAIRETILGEVRAAGLEVVMNREYPLGDGCISFGQVVYGGSGE